MPLTEELIVAIDAQLLPVYQSWFEKYDALKPHTTESELLSTMYAMFRYSYALGLYDGIKISTSDNIGPVLTLVAQLVES